MPALNSQKQNRQLYLAAVLLGLLAGGVMLFYQKQQPAPKGHCSAFTGLANFSRGEVAAFMPFAKPQMLPDISFYDANGKAYSLKEFYGQTILLNLWATWCAPCRTEMPTLDRLQQKRGDKDFFVLALSLDSGGIEKPKKFFKDIKIKSLLFYHDNEGAVFTGLRKAGLVTGLPTSFLLDRNGCVQGTLAGPANWASDEALKLIDAAKTDRH
jgi:thiol-disulfide isomerase/thioredoxin